MNYLVVYDVVNAPGPGGAFVGVGIGMTLLSGLLVLAPRLIQRAPPAKNADLRPTRIVQAVFAFSLIFTVGMIWWSFSRGLALQAASSNNTCQVVSGYVSDFSPMPAGGHAKETFRVAGIPFAFSDYEITGGFNQSASHGGPLREGLPVRICYVGDGVRSGNVIVRLEIGS